MPLVRQYYSVKDCPKLKYNAHNIRTFSLYDLVNAIPHIVHWKGLSPEIYQLLHKKSCHRHKQNANRKIIASMVLTIDIYYVQFYQYVFLYAALGQMFSAS